MQKMQTPQTPAVPQQHPYAMLNPPSAVPQQPNHQQQQLMMQMQMQRQYGGGVQNTMPNLEGVIMANRQGQQGGYSGVGLSDIGTVQRF